MEARALLAATYDQLGYQAESGPWRDVYLSAALELRQGPPAEGLGIARAGDMLRATPIEEFMKLIAATLNGPEADGKEYSFNFEFSDIDEVHTLTLKNAVLQHRSGKPAADANATIRITHELFVKMLTGNAGFKDTILSDDVSLEGSSIDLLRFFALLDPPGEVFNIVTP